ncbi:hypothetical protein P3S67_016081 [Capsicum chacoense]
MEVNSRAFLLLIQIQFSINRSLLTQSFIQLHSIYILHLVFHYTLEDKIMGDPVWDVAFLQDGVNELRNQVRDLQWELRGVRARMLREIRRLRRALLLPIEDWPADNDDDDDNSNNN